MTQSDTHKILMLAFYFPPMGMGGVQRPLKFAKYLPEFGWDVTVVAPEPGEYYHYDKSLLDELPPSVKVERVRFLHPMYWQSGGKTVAGSSSPTGRASWKTGLNAWLRWPDEKRRFAAQAIKRVRQLSRKQQFDIVWTTSPPPSDHLAGLKLSRTTGWIADFRDPWFVAENDWGPTPLHAFYNRRLHRKTVRTADRLVAVNDAIASRCDHLGPRSPTHVLHNGYDESDFAAPLESKEKSDRITIVCPGTFGQNTDPEPIFRIMRAWQDRRPDIKLRIIHAGATMTGDPARLALQYGLAENYEEIGYLSHREYLQTIRAADLLIFGVNDQDEFRGNVPGRLFELMRTLRPVLFVGPPEGAAARIISQVAGCRMASSRNIDSACAALKELTALPQDQPVRTIDSIRHYDRRDQARRLAELCTQVVAERRQRS